MSESSDTNFGDRRLTVFYGRIVAIVLAILAAVFVATYCFGEPIRSLLRWQLGAVFLAVFGALAATDGWVQHRLVEKVLGGGLAWIIVGALLAAISPVVSAYEWNEFATLEQRRKVREAVAAELVRNDDLLMKRYSLEWAEQPIAVQSREMPAMQTITLEAAISSGLFLEESDGELLARIIDVRYLMSEFNRRLLETYESTARLNDEEFRAMLRSLPNKPRMVQLRKEIQNLANLLSEKYDVRSEPKFGMDGS